MNKSIFLLLFLSIILLSSCKFDATPVGVYTGTYTAYNMPQTSGNATFTIVESGSDLYDISFIPDGNPTIYRNGIEMKRYGGMAGNGYSYYGESDPNYNDLEFRIFINEHDVYSGGEWTLSFSYQNYSVSPYTVSFDFYGIR